MTIEQSSRKACGWACLAMALGANDESVAAEAVGRWPDYPGSCSEFGRLALSAMEMTMALAERGVPAVFVEFDIEPRWFWSSDEREGYVGRQRVERHLEIEEGAAIVGVGHAGRRHWVYVSGGRVFDPAPDRRYVGLYEVFRDMRQAILIRPRAGG